jgi:spore maturation protein CgeB
MLLTNYTPGLEKLFDIGKEIVVYDSLEDLNKKVRYYLENENERNQITEAGYLRAKNEHTYDNRAQLIIDSIKSFE